MIGYCVRRQLERQTNLARAQGAKGKHADDGEPRGVGQGAEESEHLWRGGGESGCAPAGMVTWTKALASVPSPAANQRRHAQTTASRPVTASRAAHSSPWHRPDDVSNDKRPIRWVPHHDRVSLGQRYERGHGRRAGRNAVALIVLGHDHDFELAIPLGAIRHPIGVQDLHPTRLFACTWHNSLLSLINLPTVHSWESLPSPSTRG